MLAAKCNPIKAFAIERHIGLRSSIEQRITISVRYHGANHLLVRGAPEHVGSNTFFRKHRQEIIPTDWQVQEDHRSGRQLGKGHTLAFVERIGFTEQRVGWKRHEWRESNVIADL